MSSTKHARDAIRQELLNAAAQHAELAHIAVFYERLPDDENDGANALFILEHLNHVMITPLLGRRRLVAAKHHLWMSPNLLTLAADEGSYAGMVSVFCDSSSRGREGADRLSELAMPFYRCLLPNVAEKLHTRDEGSAYAMHLIHATASKCNDPVLRSRKHKLIYERVPIILDGPQGSVPRGIYEISPGHVGLFPDAPPIGLGGDSWTWEYVFDVLVQLKLTIRYLEMNPFAALAYFLDLRSETPAKAPAPSGSTPERVPYLNLDVEIETRTIRRTGCSGEVVLNGPRQWKLFYELYCAGEAGISPDDLVTAIWPGKDKADGRLCLDKAKSAAEDKLLDLQIEIAAKKAHGIWRLQPSSPV